MLLCDRRRSCSQLTLLILFVILFIVTWYEILISYHLDRHQNAAVDRKSGHSSSYRLFASTGSPVIPVSDVLHLPRETNVRCTHFTCFDVYKCDTLTSDRIKVYVYPIRRFVDSAGSLINERISQQFREILTAIVNSKYFIDDPNQACVFVPSIDLLSQSYVRLEDSSRILSLLSHFNSSSSHLQDRSGSNHLIFNFIPGSYPSYNRRIDMPLADSVIAGGGFDSWSFRSGFDIAVPVYSAFSAHCCNLTFSHYRQQRPFLLSSAQYEYVSGEKRRILTSWRSKYTDKVLLISDRCNSDNREPAVEYRKVQRCNHHKEIIPYPMILANSTFCLILPTAYLSTPLLAESLMTACIPVIVSDDAVLPFEEKIDWKRAGIRIREQLLPEVVSILSHISSQRIHKMRMYGSHVYETYFKTMTAITLTTLDILNDRLIPSAIQRKDQDIRCHNTIDL